LKFPKNINEYRHVIDTNKITDKDLEWVLDLRTHGLNSNPIEKTTNTVAPNLQTENLRNMKKKECCKMPYSMERTYWDSSFKGNSNKIEHLVRKRIGEQTNSSNLEFEATLRVFPKYNKLLFGEFSTIPSSPKKFQNVTFLPPVMNFTNKNMEKIKALIPRELDYKYEAKDITNLNYKVKSRKASPRNTTYGFLGENYGMEKYDMKYTQPNFNNFRHILSNTSSNSLSKWTCGLRNIEVNKMPLNNIKKESKNSKVKLNKSDKGDS